MKAEGVKVEGSSRHKNQATYVLCVLFWLVTFVVLAILYFALFKPRQPDVKVQAVALSSMQLRGLYSPAHHVDLGGDGSGPAVNLSLGILVLLNNPNRGTFHYSRLSAAYLYHGDSIVGFSPIPEGNVGEQDAVGLAVTLFSQASGLLSGSYITADIAAGSLTVGVCVVISGHVSVLGIFSHHTTSYSNCTVVVSLSRAALQAFSCNNDQ
ncbi:hypothetical protein KP509_05G006900 [Ceratopteris richardii]|uniref:Late embryogenesis abundant protein LEA-2 subgroup domain-containing protein n=1 Tax=Ceratopteris richardii TaxID=49495 RepID=A0A8T2UQZ8_CERRI|nr:hypothetical protein KP509_05G006900 [Ceratopteris richardii]